MRVSDRIQRIEAFLKTGTMMTLRRMGGHFWQVETVNGQKYDTNELVEAASKITDAESGRVLLQH